MRCFPRLLIIAGWALGSFFSFSIAQAETLQQVCERLERLQSKKAFREGVDQCREIGDHNSPIISAEPIVAVRERCLADCANLYKLYSDIQTDPENKQKLAIEALNGWIDYFSWFSGLSSEEQDALVKSYPQKLYAAASGLGIAALAVKDPKIIKSAWVQYEQLEDFFLDPKALNIWLAALLNPNYPVPVNDLIFFKTADDPALLKQLSEQDRVEHSHKFADRLKNLSPDESKLVKELSADDQARLAALVKKFRGAKKGISLFLEKFNLASPPKQPPPPNSK